MTNNTNNAIINTNTGSQSLERFFLEMSFTYNNDTVNQTIYIAYSLDTTYRQVLLDFLQGWLNNEPAQVPPSDPQD